MALRAINIYSPLTRPTRASAFPAFSSFAEQQHHSPRNPLSRARIFICSAVEEPSTTAVVTDKKEAEPVKAVAAAPKSKAPAKPKKAPEKPLPQLMEEEVIPALRAALEAEEDVSEVELSFGDNRSVSEVPRLPGSYHFEWYCGRPCSKVELEGSFSKKGTPYIFWAFFPDGTLTGTKGFSLSSHGSGGSTIEPFLIDVRKISAKHVVFWVTKRLAAQGILPGWKKE